MCGASVRGCPCDLEDVDFEIVGNIHDNLEMLKNK